MAVANGCFIFPPGFGEPLREKLMFMTLLRLKDLLIYSKKILKGKRFRRTLWAFRKYSSAQNLCPDKKSLKSMIKELDEKDYSINQMNRVIGHD